MSVLYAIACVYRTKRKSEPVHGIAICSDPDTPLLFIAPDGKPWLGKTIWNYTLIHTEPWCAIEVGK